MQKTDYVSGERHCGEELSECPRSAADGSASGRHLVGPVDARVQLRQGIRKSGSIARKSASLFSIDSAGWMLWSTTGEHDLGLSGQSDTHQLCHQPTAQRAHTFRCRTFSVVQTSFHVALSVEPVVSTSPVCSHSCFTSARIASLVSEDVVAPRSVVAQRSSMLLTRSFTARHATLVRWLRCRANLAFGTTAACAVRTARMECTRSYTRISMIA